MIKSKPILAWCFVFLLFTELFAVPLQYNLNKEYFLNYTVRNIEIFNSESQTNFLSYLPTNEFFVKLPEFKHESVILEGKEMASKLNAEIQTEVEGRCDGLDEPRVGIILEIIGAIVIIGGIAYLAYEAYEHGSQNKITSSDLATLEKNEKEWRQEEIQAFEIINERISLQKFFTQIQKESLNTVKNVFDGNYNYNQTFLTLPPDYRIITVSSSVQRCVNNSLEILHKVITGSNLQNFSIYKFGILGSIKDGKYIVPVIGDTFVKYKNETWAAIDKFQCWKKSGKEECTVTSLTFPHCNPSNVTSCKFVTEDADTDFFKFIEIDETVQFVTKIPTFQVKNERGVFENFIVPSNGKVSVTLSKKEELIIGNNTFCGKSEQASKITYHTPIDIPDISDELKKQDRKMTDDARKEEKHDKEIQNPSWLDEFCDAAKDFLLTHWILSIVLAILVTTIIIILVSCCCMFCCCKKTF